MFRAEISAATTTAMAVVMRWFTSPPITSRRLVNMHERDERERDPEREDDLADHERARRVDADRDHDECGQHRHRAPDEHRDLCAG